MRYLIVVAALAAPVLPPLAAQNPGQTAQERAAFVDWLLRSPTSPFAAVARQPIGDSLSVGPDTAGLPLPGGAGLLIQRGGAVLFRQGGTERTLPRGRPVRVGDRLLVIRGEPGRAVAEVYDSARARSAPQYYPYNPALVFTGPMAPAAPRAMRVLAPDGIEVTATEAGTVAIPLAGVTTRLTVMRIPDPSSGEDDLEIYFRDSTNGAGTYPAGRFVTLDPAGAGRWRLDFNAARNPFCAYSPAFPCPAPWRGNLLPGPVRAGERYEAHP